MAAPYTDPITDQYLEAHNRQQGIDELWRHVVEAPRHQEPAARERQPDKLSASELDLLRSVPRFPNDTITTRYKRLGVSADTGNRIKRALVKKDLVEQINLNLGRSTRGRVSMLALTDLGYRSLGKKPPPRRKHRCGAEHWWWQQNIYREARAKGYETHVEMSLDGRHRADVAFHRNGKWVAVEVTLGTSNVLENVRGDLNSGFSTVLLACRDERQKGAVQNELAYLSDEERQRVRLMLLSEFSFAKDLTGSQ